MSSKQYHSSQRVTLKQVAELAKVSPMTVSNFINGRFETMGSETLERVAEAVKALNYRPDTSARGLRRAKHLSIGMIIVDESPHYLADGYTTQIVSGLSNYLNECGYTLQLEGVRARDLENSSLIQHIRTDGLCLMLSGRGAVRRAQMALLKRLTQPLIVFLESIKSPNLDACCIMSDDREGGGLLTQHLLERGARRIVMLMPSLNYWKAMYARYEGAREIFDASGVTGSLGFVDCGDGSVSQTQSALAEEIDQAGIPDAIMGVNDQVGIAALNLLRSMDVEVPNRVRITGFNAFEFREFSRPLLTSVQSPGYEMGYIGGRELLSRLKDGRFSRRRIKLPVQFAPGETT